MASKDPADGRDTPVGGASRSPPSVDTATSGAIADSTPTGDQSVSVVIQSDSSSSETESSSSDSEPTVSPAKQGKMSFEEEEMAKAAASEMKKVEEQQPSQQQDAHHPTEAVTAPPDVFWSESNDGEINHSSTRVDSDEHLRDNHEGKMDSTDIPGITAPSPVDSALQNELDASTPPPVLPTEEQDDAAVESFVAQYPCETMGQTSSQTLSEPVTAKETVSCGDGYAKVGSSCMQGWRINMEDSHTHLLAGDKDGDKEAYFFAVYDGHGGAKVAQYAGNHLHKRIIKSELYAQGDIEEAIRQGFLKLDEDMIKDEEMKEESAGTTAVIVIVKGNRMYCGNVGDSRAIASCSGVAEPLSYDHKPANEDEAKRIIAAGGWVEFDKTDKIHRVHKSGVALALAPSRALGDFIFKRNDDKSAEEQIVTAFPDVIVRDINEDHEFLLLACDGIWDVMTNQVAIDFCRGRLASGMAPETVCEELLTRCLAPACRTDGLGCDNMTVVLVCLLQHKGYEMFRQKCARPRLVDRAAGGGGGRGGGTDSYENNENIDNDCLSVFFRK